MLLALLLGCSVYEKVFDLLEEPPVPPCDDRAAWWEDLDGDGHGNPAEVWVSCDEPAGWVAVGDDCDDADPTVTSGCADTGDTGADTGDTGADTGDTSDTSTDTADTGADTGDTSDTSHDTGAVDSGDTSPDTSDTSGDTSDTSGDTDTADTPEPPASRPRP